jgi:transketolase
VVALCADLIGSLKFDDFKKNHPERFSKSVAEANMIGIAAGLTIGGKIHLQELSLTSLQEECMTKFVNQSPLIKCKICASHAGLNIRKTVQHKSSKTLV